MALFNNLPEGNNRMNDPYEIQQGIIHRTTMEMRNGGVKLHPIMPRIRYLRSDKCESKSITPHVLTVLILILATLISESL